MPYVDIQQFLDEDYPRGRRYYWKSATIGELSDEVIDIVADFAARQPSPISTIDVWLMGGALRREPPGGVAYSGREVGLPGESGGRLGRPGDGRRQRRLGAGASSRR